MDMVFLWMLCLLCPSRSYMPLIRRNNSLDQNEWQCGM
uniref:Uncharacterized protein n=1 Tax=Arundo donax TaxID=35708 RepID=A0A0A9BHW4_ARUDO